MDRQLKKLFKVKLKVNCEFRIPRKVLSILKASSMWNIDEYSPEYALFTGEHFHFGRSGSHYHKDIYINPFELLKAVLIFFMNEFYRVKLNRDGLRRSLFWM